MLKRARTGPGLPVVVGVVVVALLGSGCSFLFVTPGRSGASQKVNRSCTESNAWPGVDLVLAALEVVRTGAAIGASEDAYRGIPVSRSADVAIGVLLASVATGSAVYGFSATAECRELDASDRRDGDEDEPLFHPRRVGAPRAPVVPYDAPAVAPAATVDGGAPVSADGGAAGGAAPPPPPGTVKPAPAARPAPVVKPAPPAT